MRILVIPDIHLKPWIFEAAARIYKATKADGAVCLMDIADDWGQHDNIELYRQTYDSAIDFAENFDNTLWCYGNHDLSYEWLGSASGYSAAAAETVKSKLNELRDSLKYPGQIAYVQRIDDVLFMHGGLTEYFVKKYVPAQLYEDTDKVLETVNRLGYPEMWEYVSPIWSRPQHDGMRMYRSDRLLQVVGHTPVDDIYCKDNVISCDVFSTSRKHKNVGSMRLAVIDTVTWQYEKYETDHPQMSDIG